MRRLSGHKRGLSEIVGTLMLVVIVVSAATLLAAFVATYQKQLQTEEAFTHDQSLESIHILGLTSSVSSGSFTSFGFTIASEYVNPSIVQAFTINQAPLRSFLWDNLTTSTTGSYFLGQNFYLLAFNQVSITLCLSASCPIPGGDTPSAPATSLNPPSTSETGPMWTGTGDAYFPVSSGFTWEAWDSIELAATTDITDSGGGCTGPTTAGSITAAATGETVSTTPPYTLTVPFTYSFEDASCTSPPTGVGLAATSDAIFSLGIPFSFLSPSEVPLPNQYLKFDIYTYLQNDFTRVYLPPSPLPTVSEINPSGNNPITLLDGSMSFQPGSNESIVNWDWSISGSMLASSTSSSTINNPPSGGPSLWTGTGIADFVVPGGFAWEAGDSIALTSLSYLSDTNAATDGCSAIANPTTLTAIPSEEMVVGSTLVVPYTYSVTESAACSATPAYSLATGGATLSATVGIDASGEEYEISPALPSSGGPYSVTLAVTNSDGLIGTVTVSYTPPAS